MSLKYRIYPSKKQQLKLNHSFWLAKELHNHLLQYCKDKYVASKKGSEKFSPSKFSLSYEIARIRKENPEFKKEYSHVLQEVGGRIGAAYSSFFRRVKEKQAGKKIKAGFPRFKKKVYSLTYPDAYGVGYKLESNKILNVSKIGRIPIKADRILQGNIKTMILSKDGTRWYASFSTDSNKVIDKIAENRTAIGIDLGVTTFATFSDGTNIENPRFYKQAQVKIKRLQKSLSRKVKGSNNRKKAGMKLWRAHQRVEDMRSDFIHKVTTDLVRNHSLIAVEDFKTSNMLLSAYLSSFK